MENKEKKKKDKKIVSMNQQSWESIEYGTIVLLKHRTEDLGLSTSLPRVLEKEVYRKGKLMMVKTAMPKGICIVVEKGEKKGIRYLTLIRKKHWLVPDPRNSFPVVDVPFDLSIIEILSKEKQVITNRYAKNRLSPQEYKKLVSKNFHGDSFRVHCKIIMKKFKNFSKVRLVHGNVMFNGIVFGRAWIELNGKVLDFTDGNYNVFKKKNYYLDFNIKKVKRYTRFQVILKVRKKRNYGPWESWIL